VTTGIASALGQTAAAPRGNANAPRRIALAPVASVTSESNEARDPKRPRVLRNPRPRPRRQPTTVASSGRFGAKRSVARPTPAPPLRLSPPRRPAKRRLPPALRLPPVHRLPPARRLLPVTRPQRRAIRHPRLVRFGCI
jgi:hypothetical protein